MTLDELDAYGMVRMDDDEIRAYLSGQSVGVLGLPTGEGVPLLRPLSFGFDGEDTLYFVYVLGAESRKREVSDWADRASFLVYSADTPFNWRSVLLAGHVEEVPDDDHEVALTATEHAWRPDVFAAAIEGEATALYRFEIEEWTGLKHLGLPPELETEGIE
ncbi:MAG: pyridoxamine 5'-phosphate oxidase family protein [Haloplanus sp.]